VNSTIQSIYRIHSSGKREDYNVACVKIKEWRAYRRAFVWGESIHNKSLIKRPNKMLVLFTLFESSPS